MAHQINIFIHVLAGSLALLIGIIPFFSSKGGKTHKKYGRIFLYFVMVVIVTAIIGLLLYRSRPFLIVLTLLASYQAFTGFRITQSKQAGPGRWDFIFSAACFSYGLVFIYLLPDLSPLMNKAIIYYTMFFLFMIMGYDMARFLFINKWKPKQLWVYEHIFKMVGAYTGLFSAFTGTVLAKWEPYNTMVPSVLGFLLIIGLIIRQSKNRNFKF